MNLDILLTVDPEIPVPPIHYGGIERIVDGLARGLRSRGHRVALLAHRDSSCPVDACFTWAAPNGQGLLHDASNVACLLRAVRDFSPAVVHSFSRLAYLLPALPFRIPMIMSYQRHTGGHKLRAMATLGGRRFAFTGCSQYIAAMGECVGGRWFAIPNFVDSEYFEFQANVADDAPLVFLSRIERIKGTHTAIAIARRAGRRLVIAGNLPNTPKEHAYWRDEIEPCLEAGVVDYVGPVNDAQKNRLLGNALAMVVPVEWDEPFGIVFAESLACGTPVLASPRGALPEIVEDGVHGFLVRSIDEGVAAVRKLPQISRAACRDRVETRFSRKVVVERYEQLYRDLVEGERS